MIRVTVPPVVHETPIIVDGEHVQTVRIYLLDELHVRMYLARAKYEDLEHLLVEMYANAFHEDGEPLSDREDDL